MKKQLIIEKYGLGHAVIILDQEKIVDLFIDPPPNANFYSPNTFIEAKIQRRISKRGGYFVQLPNGSNGFLKSNSDYKEGEAVVLLSKVFFDEDKPQIFTDKLKIKSKYFVLKLGESGFSFSKKTSKSLNKKILIPILEANIRQQNEIFIICRPQVADISTEQFYNELKKIFEHYEFIMKEILLKKIYCDGLAKKTALDKYDIENFFVIEETGIFEQLGLWDKIDKFCQRKFDMLSGAYLIIEQTSSFFAIDVNSGRDLKVGAEELNLLASGEICRLIKVLGLGGKIIIDFLPCSRLGKKNIYKHIAASFLNDTPANKIWGWTNGGSFELERERDKSPLNLLIQHN